MASKHVEHLEKLRDALRHERRAQAAELASSIEAGNGVAADEAGEFGELQRNLDAVMRAIEDEIEQEVLRTANPKEPWPPE
jgi:hypothetical protein